MDGGGSRGKEKGQKQEAFGSLLGARRRRLTPDVVHSTDVSTKATRCGTSVARSFLSQNRSIIRLLFHFPIATVSKVSTNILA
jgi:hypothetical protein